MKTVVNRKVILFDGVCNLCNGAVNFVIKHDKKEKFYFASLQSDYGQEILASLSLQSNELKTLIYQDGDEIYFKSEAIIRICKDAGGWLKIAVLGYVFPLFIRDFIYKLIANNRYKLFGKREECIIPDKRIQKRFLE